MTRDLRLRARLRARAGGIMLVAGNQELAGARREDARLETLLDAAVEGLRVLIRADQQQV